MEFKFIREGDVFSWQNDSYKLTFSDPHIQPWHDENRKIYTAQDILYYYYDLDTYSRNGSEWEKVSGIRAFDFPAIFRLLDVVEYALTVEPEDSKKSDIPNGAVEQEYDTTYWVCEDYYSVKCYTDVCGERSYEVYAGREDKGIRVTVNEWELYELKKCIEAFVQYSIDHSNECINSRNISYCASHRAKNGRLYEYYMDFSGEGIAVDDASVTDIFIKGDKVKSVTVLIREGDDYYSEHIYDKVIAEVTDKELKYTDGSAVSTDRILLLNRDVSDEEHSYDIGRVTEDFLSRLCAVERADFAELSEEELFHKYHHAITDRTHLYRGEHNFPMLIKTEDSRDNVDEAVRRVLKSIKSKLLYDLKIK